MSLRLFDITAEDGTCVRSCPLSKLITPKPPSLSSLSTAFITRDDISLDEWTGFIIDEEGSIASATSPSCLTATRKRLGPWEMLRFRSRSRPDESTYIGDILNHRQESAIRNVTLQSCDLDLAPLSQAMAARLALLEGYSITQLHVANRVDRQVGNILEIGPLCTDLHTRNTPSLSPRDSSIALMATHAMVLGNLIDYKIKFSTLDRFMSTWRRGIFYMDGPPSPWLIPDVFSFHFQHFLDTRQMSYEEFAAYWHNKTELMFWRGSTTGASLDQHGDHNLRVRACKQMLSEAKSDIKISNICQVRDTDIHREEMLKAGILGEAISPEKFQSFKYYPDLPGNSMSWGSIRNHAYGALVFRPTSYSDSGHYRDAGLLWHHEMLPWSHYIPVKEDFSDLSLKLEWALLNDTQASVIAWNGMTRARKYLSEVEDILLCKLHKAAKSRFSIPNNLA